MRRIWQRLSKREKGLVVSSLVICLLVLARYFLLSPFLEHREWVKGQLDMQPQLLEKNLRYLGKKEGMAASLEKARAELRTLEAALLTGDTPPVSASDLQQTIQALAAKGGAQVISTRVLSPEAMGSFTKIPIQMEVGGQIDQIADLIKGMESTEKLVVIGDLSIRSLFTPAAAPRLPTAPQQQAVPQVPAQTLRVSLVVSGFTRSRASPPEKSEPASAKTKADQEKAPTKSGPRR